MPNINHMILLMVSDILGTDMANPKYERMVGIVLIRINNNTYDLFFIKGMIKNIKNRAMRYQ